jgi:hypothetical protein
LVSDAADTQRQREVTIGRHGRQLRCNRDHARFAVGCNFPSANKRCVPFSATLLTGHCTGCNASYLASSNSDNVLMSKVRQI